MWKRGKEKWLTMDPKSMSSEDERGGGRDKVMRGRKKTREGWVGDGKRSV